MTEVIHQREEGDLVIEEEEGDVEEEDDKRKNMMKRNLLTSPKLSAIIVKRGGISLMNVTLK